MMLLLLALCAFSVVLASGDAERNKNVLVLMEQAWTKETHSILFSSLMAKGYHLNYQLADSSTLSLTKNGEYVYGSVIILAPSVRDFGGKIDAKSLLRFVDEGGNVVVAAASDVGQAIRQFASGCGVDFNEEDSTVIDHFSHDIMDDGKHTLITVPSSNLVKSDVMTGKVQKPLLFRGVGMSIDPNNPLLISVLHASETAYSHKPYEPVSDTPHTVGTDTKLITALQARNNARVLFFGSMDFLSDQFFLSSVKSSNIESKSSGNRDLVDNLMPWAFGERGQLRVASVKHHPPGHSHAPQQYRITDELVYTIEIETKDDKGIWKPFIADDVQLELIRIDPFIRRTIPHKGGVYSTVIKLPDVNGVYKLTVDYFRLGYTHLVDIKQIAVRPYQHTEYERFIETAYPYYSSAISMVVGLVIFSFFFLYFKDEKEKSE